MLNNTTLTAKQAEAIRFQLGDVYPGLTGEALVAELEDDGYAVTDTREPLENFRFNEVRGGAWYEKGVRHYGATVQRRKGEQRVMFIFIPGDEFNVVLLGDA